MNPVLVIPFSLILSIAISTLSHFFPRHSGWYKATLLASVSVIVALTLASGVIWPDADLAIIHLIIAFLIVIIPLATIR